jgi:hypothetical protein
MNLQSPISPGEWDENADPVSTGLMDGILDTRVLDEPLFI